MFNAFMQRFFEDFESIKQFTRSLDYYQDKLECAHCLKQDQFVSHGIVYKQRSMLLSEPVGKRIFCSNRYGRSGCGRTFQLYVASELPSFQYGTAHLFVFIASLLANMTVIKSYEKATGQSVSRNAWRWINKLMCRLIDYRSVLRTRAETISTQFRAKARRLQVLLPTIAQLFSRLKEHPCAIYQLLSQSSFI